MTADFADFYADLHPRLVAWASAAFGHADAEEVAQEALVRAYVAYGRLDPDADPWPWVTAIARNAARDRHRCDRRLMPLDQLRDEESADEPYESALVAERRRATVRALARLPERDRALLLLRDGHGLGIDEIARRDGRPSGALRQHLARARRRFAREYTALGGRALGVLATRWYALRRRATPWADTIGAAVPAAAVVFAVVAGGTSAAGAAGVHDGGTARDVAVARPGHDGRAFATRRAGATVAPAHPAKTARSLAAPAAGPAHVAIRAPGFELDGVPGVEPSRNDHRAHVPVGGKDVYVEGGGWSSDQHDAVCSLPPVEC